MMKKQLITTCLVVMGMSSFGFSQANKRMQTEPAKKEVAPTQKPMTDEQIAERRADELRDQLNLTDMQHAKIFELHLGVSRKNDAVKANPNFSEAEKKELIQENEKNKAQMLNDMLTEEQRVQLKKIEAQPAAPAKQ
eukprot:TRINITY_DN119870_c0_g1_i1.p1 TRINITY_DN119870_c0_g1~~TRINITY_DN119870_c0_g1_i1.p1  ORF type:complete len:144 (-),score=4.73 TRINITY_DN119870_c0_g1_i1:63-473(-)